MPVRKWAKAFLPVESSSYPFLLVDKCWRTRFCVLWRDRTRLRSAWDQSKYAHDLAWHCNQFLFQVTDDPSQLGSWFLLWCSGALDIWLLSEPWRVRLGWWHSPMMLG